MAKRPKQKPMDEETFAGIVQAAITDAVDYIDDDVAPDRIAASAYYRGDPMGNEEDGRSQIRMTEVRDVVLAIMPSLMRVFCGSEHVVEFTPNRQDQIEQAEQATDYVNHIFHNDNPGFEILWNAFKDALIRKTGVIMWYPQKSKKVSEHRLSGLTQEEIELLRLDPTLEILDEEEDGEEEDEYGPLDDEFQAPDELSSDDYAEEEGGVETAMADDTAGPYPQDAEKTFTATIRRTERTVRFKVECIPPEEFLISREARDVATTPFAGRRREMPIGELVAMGYDRDEIEENAGTSTGFETNTERETRVPSGNWNQASASEADPAMRKVLYTEGFVQCDYDGDGIPEWVRVCTIGATSPYILHREIVSEDDAPPFAILCPDPEPHTAIGYSMADQVVDLQEIKTNVVRNTLDSLAQAIHPDLLMVDGQANAADVLSTRVGRVIRVRNPDAVRELTKSFIGPAALEIINYLDRIRAQRTGITETTQGLDPDALQSTTKAAVTAATAAAQQRLELIARIFAETGIKRLFKGILRMVIQHQDKERVIRLRGKWVSVDPRYWDADMDVAADVAKGMGNVQEKIGTLMQVAQTQQMIIQTMGPTNPLCSPVELRNTFAKILELSGFKDVDRYWKPFGQAEMQQMVAAEAEKAKNPPTDPAAMLAQIETQKVQQKAQADTAKATLDAIKVKLEDDRERDRMAQDFTLKQAELANKQVTAQQEAVMRFEMERERNTMNAANAAAGPAQPQPQAQPAPGVQ